jgi:hypothetical protein
VFALSYPEGYTTGVIEIRQTDEFSRWFDRLKDRQARFRILAPPWWFCSRAATNVRRSETSRKPKSWLEDSRRE